MRRLISLLIATSLFLATFATPALADHRRSKSFDGNFVEFVAEQADKRGGKFNIIGNVVLTLAGEGLLDDVLPVVSNDEITAFLPTDFAFRRLAADLTGQRWWQVKESEVVGILTSDPVNLDLATIAVVVKYHIYAGELGKVDYRTALSLDENRRNGTDVFITMANGGELGIDRRGWFLQLDDSGAALGIANNPWVIRPNIDGGNAIVHGISEVLLP